MPVSIGGVEPQKEIVELWYELVKTQAILETVLKKSSQQNCSMPLLDKNDLQKCEDKALHAVQTRFPYLGVMRK